MGKFSLEWVGVGITHPQRSMPYASTRVLILDMPLVWKNTFQEWILMQKLNRQALPRAASFKTSVLEVRQGRIPNF